MQHWELNHERKHTTWIIVLIPFSLSFSPSFAFLSRLLVALAFKSSLIPSTLCSWEALHFENT